MAPEKRGEIENYYDLTHCCDGTATGSDPSKINAQKIDLSKWSKTIRKIAKDLFDGKKEIINADLMQKTYDTLAAGVIEGFGDKWHDMDYLPTTQALRQNLYKFSGAKTAAQLKEMNAQLVDDKGRIRSFDDFKRKVMATHKKYNQNYLQAEWQTAKTTGQHIREWGELQKNKDLYPNLRYKTVGDGRVREKHQALRGIIKPIDDPFWNSYYPPNGWRCRCYTQPTKAKPTEGKAPIKPDKGFDFNPAKKQEIFNSDKHPYFAYTAAKGFIAAFEKLKPSMPYGKPRYKAENGATVAVHPYADKQDLMGNYRASIKMAESGISSKIREHIDKKGVKNPEYEIDGIQGDRALPKTKNLRKGVSNSFDVKLGKNHGKEGQLRNLKNTFIVFDFSFHDVTAQGYREIASQAWSKMRHYQNVDELIFIFKGGVRRVKRSLLREGFEKFEEAIKIKNQ